MKLPKALCSTCRTRTVMIAMAVWLVCLLSSMASAAPWAVVANTAGSVNTIDLGGIPAVYGPFLEGTFGAGELLDVAVTPDGKYAIVSHFQTSMLYRLDITDPASPVLTGTLNVGMLAEDVAISADGRLAVVADGGGSTTIAFVDLASFTLNGVYPLQTPGGTAEAVAIAPDNKTVILCDTFNNRVIYGAINAAGDGLATEQALPAGNMPINVAISPDGKTALVVNNSGGMVSIYEITAPGEVAARMTVGGVGDIGQSIAFNPAGSKAYVLSQASSPDSLAILAMDAQGGAVLEGVVTLLTDGRSYYGVDTLAISADGKYALVSNSSGLPNNPALTVVDLDTLAVAPLATGKVPSGVAFVGGVPPTISGTPAVQGQVGQPYYFAPSASNAVSFSIINKPAWADFDPATGVLSGTPDVAGIYGDIIISASNSDGTASLPPFAITVNPGLVSCGAPSIVSLPAANSTGKFIVFWTSSRTSGVTYVLEQSYKGGPFAEVYRGATIQATVTVSSSGSYSYRVKAVKAGYNDSAYRNGSNVCAVDLVCVAPSTVTVPAINSTGKFNVLWNNSNVPGVTYVLEQSRNDAPYVEIYRGANMQAAVTVSASGTYSYRVKAVKTNYSDSAYRNGGTACTVNLTCGAPTTLSVPATNSTGKFTVVWNSSNVSGVAYVLEQSYNGAAYSEVYRGANTQATVSVSASGSYGYRVKAVKAEYSDSAYRNGGTSCTVSLTCGAPTTLSVPATNNTGTFTVVWNSSNVSGVTYVLEQSYNGGAYSEVYRGAGTQAAVNVTLTGSYTYRVKAVKTGYSDSTYTNGANPCVVS